ncbi:class I SAM-dependent methyltransferase [Nocardia brevicatena]|uniref:class I SAM-dependent methyltransferase n=1 Tax=Nocardia brevicatena TaxID=37327 RepID=UPI0034D4DBB5
MGSTATRGTHPRFGKPFEIRSPVNDRHDYSTTCAEWLRRLRAHRSDAERLVGARVADVYERYLEASIRQFDEEHLVLYRILLRKAAGPVRLSE